MAKRSTDEILDDSLPENVTKRKYNDPLFPSMNSRTIIFLAPSLLEKYNISSSSREIKWPFSPD